MLPVSTSGLSSLGSAALMQRIEQRVELPPLCQTHCASVVQTVAKSVQKIFLLSK
jgi:hypothetical protein